MDTCVHFYIVFKFGASHALQGGLLSINLPYINGLIDNPETNDKIIICDDEIQWRKI